MKCITFMQQSVQTQWSNKLWVNILADNEADVKTILEKVTQGKKY